MSKRRGRPSDPDRPGSDAWAGLDADSVETWNRGMAQLREEMLAIRRHARYSGGWADWWARKRRIAKDRQNPHAK